MPTLVSRLSSLVRGARRALAFSVLCASATLAACGGSGGGGDGSGTTGPGSKRATLTLTSQTLLASGTTGASLQITPAYDRTSGDPVALAAQTVAVSGASQQAPLTVDLTGCLADAAHSGGSDACNVRATVSLVAGDGRVLDTQTVGPSALKSGGSATLAVSLAEVASVRVTAPAVGADGRAQIQIGQTPTAAAAALDANGGVLANRAVRWTVDAQTVATVDAATGVITPVAPGQARLTATISGRTGSVDLTVVRAPSPINVVVAGGAGSGTVTSSPAGISCTVTAGVASGTCAAPFPADAAVTLTAAPVTGSAFSGWSNACSASGGALTCPLPASSAARTAGVSFAKVQNLAVTIAGAGTGRVTSDPAGIACQKASGVCATGFGEGSTVTLTATADAGSTFAGWSGACAGTGTCPLTMDQARAATATFTSIAADTITVSALSATNGLHGSLSVSGTLNGRPLVSSITIDLNTAIAAPQFTFYVDPGTQATLNFAATNGATFVSWGGACAGTATNAACTAAPTPRLSRRDVIVNLAP